MAGIALGGLASGFTDTSRMLNEQARTAIFDRQQKAQEQLQLLQEAQKSIGDMVSHASDIAKAVADQGGDPSQLGQNESFKALVQGAMRTAALTNGRIDPQAVAAQFQTILQRPPVPEQKTLTTIPGGPVGEGQAVTFGSRTGTVIPVQPQGQPVPTAAPAAGGSMLGGMSGMAPGEKIGGPEPAPTQPAMKVASAFSSLEQPPPSTPETAPPPVQRFKPGSLPLADAIRLGVTGDEFLKATVPPNLQNAVRDVADYKVPLNSFSSRAYKGGESQRQIIYNLVSQYTNHQFDEKYYGAMKAAIKEFTSGGNNSPAGQITFGNTAIQHLGEVSDSLTAIQSIPGLMSKIADAGIPLASYAARAVRNTAIRGTPEGRALAEFLDARNRYVEEITKFYAGSQGAEADRARSLAVVDPNLSATEMNGVINKEATLMASKVNALQDRWKTALAGPRFSDALFRNAIPDFPIMQDKTKEAITKIIVRARPENGALPAGGAGPATAPTGSGWSIQRVQ